MLENANKLIVIGGAIGGAAGGVITRVARNSSLSAVTWVEAACSGGVFVPTCDRLVPGS